ncbi:MAG: EAL domain-containing protein [Rhodocyclaceae bacterium]|nr:EAL domain-containing protein [Rhodocyclaceae bacterium]
MDIFPIRRPPDAVPETLVPDLSDGAEAGLYLALFELVEEGLIITSDETILEVNSAACRLLERSYPQLVGHSLSELFPTEAAFLAARGVLFVEGASRGSLLLRLPGGRRRHLRCLSAARVRPGVHALVLSPDTAAVEVPPSEAEPTDALWPRLAAAVQQPVLVIGADGLVKAANATARARLGRDRALIGQDFDGLRIDSAGCRTLPGPQPGWRVVALPYPDDGRGAKVVSHPPADGSPRRAFDALPMPALICAGDDGRIVDVNPAAEQAYAFARGELQQMRLSQLQVADANGSDRQIHRRKDGSEFEVDVATVELRSADGNAERLVMHRPPPTPDAVQLFASELFGLSDDGVLILDHALRIVAANPAICRLTGFERRQLLGEPATILVPDGTGNPFEAARQEASGRLRRDLPTRRHDATAVPSIIRIARVQRKLAAAPHYLVTIRHAIEAASQACGPDPVDGVTGLPDRAGLAGPYMALACRNRQSRRKLALMVIDLDCFHRVNAQLGEAHADRLLAQLGERLVMAAPDDSAVARIGADSFVILVGELHGRDDVLALAEGILDLVAEPIKAGPTTVTLAATIGGAIGPDHGEDLASLLSAAEHALHAARSASRPVHLFDVADTVDSLARSGLDAAIRRAPDRGELALHWQPRYRLADSALIGAEALLRWNHPQLGLLVAEQFVPSAIRTGSITALGRWALAHVCEQAAAWHEAFECDLTVSINIAARELERPEFTDELEDYVRQAALRPQLLELELIDCATLPRNAAAMNNLYALQELGVRLRIDRFGSDGSPLSALRHLPLSGLKIDPQFVRDLQLGDEGSVMIEAILQTARGLSLDVVAAGVENAAQRDRLAALGCSASQGLFHGPPVDAEAFGRIIAAELGRSAT